MNVVIYGRKGCGKTLNAKKLADHFGCKNIVEVEDTVFDESKRPIDTLFLTNKAYWYIGDLQLIGEAKFISFENAIIQVEQPVKIPEFLRQAGSFGGGE